MKTYRLAIFGAGSWSKNYVKTIEKFPNIELVALFRRKNIRPDFIPDNCKFYHTNGDNIYQYHSLLNSLDGVIIAVDHDATTLINDLRSYDNLSILAEKPLITYAKNLDLILNTKKIQVNYIHLFSDPFQKIKEMVDGKKITRIYSYGFGPSKTREHFSPLWDYGPHDLSMILSLKNSAPNDIYIRSHNKTQAGETFTINLSFDGLKTKSIVGNGTIIKGRYLYIKYDDGEIENELVYDDLCNNKLLLNNEPIEYNRTKLPLENSINSFLRLIDGHQDYRFGLDLTVKITKILSSYIE